MMELHIADSELAIILDFLIFCIPAMPTGSLYTEYTMNIILTTLRALVSIPFCFPQGNSLGFYQVVVY